MRVGSDRLASWLFAAFVTCIVVAAALAPWEIVGAIDAKTYFEMILGIARHGWPIVENGPIERFPEMQVRWNVLSAGTLWGNYPPLYPYLMAPLFGLGGLTAVNQANIAIFALLAVATYCLCREVTQNRAHAAAAGMLVVLANGAPIWSIKPTSFPLATTLIAVAAYCALRSLRPTGGEGSNGGATAWAVAAGFVAALGGASHVMVIPMLVALVVALALNDRRRALSAAAGAAGPLLSVAAFNWMRFGTFNPMTYGPCQWRICETPRGAESAAAMLLHASPLIGFAAALGLVAWLGRTWRQRVLGTGVVALTALWLFPVVADRLALYFGATAGILITPELLSLGGGPDGREPGWFASRPFVFRTLLQASPFLAFAVFARTGNRRALLLWLPVLAVIATIALRANMAVINILGHSRFFLRYLLPLTPFLVVLAMSAVERLEWRRNHVLGGIALAGLLALWLGLGDGSSGAKAIVVKTIPLGLVAAGCLTLWLEQRRPESDGGQRAATAWIVAAAVAWSIGTATGIAAPIAVREAHAWTQRIEHYRSQLPPRFAVVGTQPRPFASLLALKASHDVEYAALEELGRWREARRVIQHWIEEDKRPVYLVLPRPLRWRGVHWGSSPWPTLRFEPVTPEPGRAPTMVRITERSADA